MSDWNTLERDIEAKIKKKIIPALKVKIINILNEERQEAIKVANLIGRQTIVETFSYQYGKVIDEDSVSKAILSVNLDGNFRTNVNFDENIVKFKPVEEKDVSKFNYNALKDRDYLLDQALLLDTEDSLYLVALQNDVEEELSYVEAQIYTNNKKWGSQDFNWANKENLQGAYQPVNITAKRAKEEVESRFQKDYKTKIEPKYKKKIEDTVSSTLKGGK